MCWVHSHIKEFSAAKRAELLILFFIRHVTMASSWPGWWSLSAQGNITRWLGQDLCTAVVPSCQPLYFLLHWRNECRLLLASYSRDSKWLSGEMSYILAHSSSSGPEGFFCVYGEVFCWSNTSLHLFTFFLSTPV